MTARLAAPLLAACLLAVSAAPLAAASPPDKRVPVLFDTDIGTGVDDAFALALLLASPELELRGVTTVSAGAADRAWIVCRFLSHAGVDKVPVASGRGDQPAAAIDGQIQYRRHPAVIFDRTHKPAEQPAIDLLRAQLAQARDKVTIIAAGPLTNLARLLADHPDSKDSIARIIAVGGRLAPRGDRGDAELPARDNFRADPAAARTVLASGVPLLVVPADVPARLQLGEPRLRQIFGACTRLTYQVQALYQLWDRSRPTLLSPAAVTLAIGDRFFETKAVRLEIDDEGYLHRARGKANARVVEAADAGKFLDFCAERMAGHGERSLPDPPRHVSKVIPRGNLPVRVHAFEDYETDIERRWWMSGKAETADVPPGSRRACRGVLTQDFDDRQGNRQTAYGAVIFNPVPGPPMGPRTRLAFRYRLEGTDTLRVQLYSLSNGYHRYLTLTGLPTGSWQSAAVDMTHMRRPDGSGGPLSADERIDDIQFYIEPRAELLIDDVVLYEAAPAGERRPFPNRIVFTGWFDTGRQGREWPGDFEIVPHEAPRTWDAARSVPHPDTGKPWLRVHFRGRRPLGERTRARFDARLTGATALRVVLADTETGQTREARVTGLDGDDWHHRYIDLAPSPGEKPPMKYADEIRFYLNGDATLWLDDLLVYEPGDSEAANGQRDKGAK